MNAFKWPIAHPLTLWIITACAVCDAKAAPILDQFHNPEVTTLAEVDEGIDHAQTFTVGVAGILTSVDLLLCRGLNTTQDLLFDVRRTVGGVPIEDDGSTLANVRVPSTRVPIHDVQFVNVDISVFNLLVSPGDVLALVLRPSEPFVQGDDDGYGWGGSLQGNQYAEGTRYSRGVFLGIPWEPFPARDMGFATYIGGDGTPPPPLIRPVPEPATLPCVGAGLAGMGAVWRRRREANRTSDSTRD